MSLTERELGDVVDDLMTDFPGTDREVLDRAVHEVASQSPKNTANQVEQAARMRLHLKHQGDH
jgi:hypothetical protein